MHISRVSPSQIETKRLDSDYYRPEYLETERVLRGLSAEPLKQVGKFWAGPFGSELPSSLYLNEGVPLFRVGNVGNLQVLYDRMAHLDPAVHENLSASEVRPGDLLVVKASVGEKICKVPESMPRANITQHIIAIRPNGKVDFDYIAAFLFGRYGRSQLVRRSLGSIIQYLGVNDARTVLYPPIDRNAQIYVGDKLRQAELLREQLVALELDVRRCFTLDEVVGIQPAIRKAFRVPEKRITSDRLDAPFHDPAYFELTDKLGQMGARVLSSVAQQIRERWKRHEPEFLYLDIGHVNRAYGTVEPVRLPTLDAPSRAQRLVRPWDVLVSTVRANRKNVAIVSEVDHGLPLVASTGFCVLRFSSPEEAVFYHAWLRSDLATVQLMQWTGGGTYPDIDEDVAIQTLVPLFDDALVRTLGKRWKLRLNAAHLSGALTTTAAILVESLVDGKLTEAEITEAQLAIESGDDTLDRQLLNRLTLRGIDVAGAPKVFPDIDDLYLTLQEAACAPRVKTK
jgi:type I restriction enzyme S subunit